MRKDFGAKPYTYPQPVLMIATYGEDGKPDVMNAAWGGISDDKEISICVSESHKTTENILKKWRFHSKHGGCGSYDSLRLCGNCFRKQRAG